MSEFPTLKIKDLQIDVSDDELGQISTNREFIKPGRQKLKITKLENKGPAKNDSTFLNVSVQLESTTGAEIRDFLLIPTVRMRYEGAANQKGQLYPLQRLAHFFEAFEGPGVSSKDVPKLINQYFAKEGAVGKTVEVLVGYKAPHVAYKGPDLYVLCDKDGNEMKTDTGAYVAAGRDRKEAINNAIIAGYDGKKRADFPSILSYSAGEKDVEEADTDF